MYTFHQIGSDFVFCAGARFFPRGLEPEVDGRRRPLCHCASSLCNYHVHHIQNVQRCSFVSLFVRHLSQMPKCWNGYSATYCTGVWHAPANNPIFSPACVLRQLPKSQICVINRCEEQPSQEGFSVEHPVSIKIFQLNYLWRVEVSGK